MYENNIQIQISVVFLRNSLDLNTSYVFKLVLM